ncbi:MAG: hypothetical protein QOF49_2280 [Chloroflexota bacterium]|nr:hypothetical protein [Chloroflexota bacterium]
MGDDPLLTLDSIPMDALKGSPETLNAWLDTYLKYREVREVRKATEALADVAETTAESGAAAGPASAAGPTAADRDGGDPSSPTA